MSSSGHLSTIKILRLKLFSSCFLRLDRMSGYLFPVYIFSFFVGLSIIFLVISLKNRYRLSCLTNYVYYLIFFIVFGFVNLTARFIVFKILADQTPQTMKLITAIFTLLAFPFVPIMVYFFINSFLN